MTTETTVELDGRKYWVVRDRTNVVEIKYKDLTKGITNLTLSGRVAKKVLKAEKNFKPADVIKPEKPKKKGSTMAEIKKTVEDGVKKAKKKVTPPKEENSNLKNPTPKNYSSFQHAYDFYNQELFGGQLPNCLITMQRKGSAYGYYSAERWNDTADAERIDEMAMNPAFFKTKTPDFILSVLVHEMCHVWQFHHGEKKAKGGYHNNEWADKMESVGLTPSHDESEGGRRTGIRMSHYVTPGGLFIKATETLIKKYGWKLPYIANEPDLKRAKAKKASKTKFNCPVCDSNSWGKPDSVLYCGFTDECNKALMVAEIQEDEGDE